MTKQAMVCGVDCFQGDGKNCNGYCLGMADSPREATEAQKLEAARTAAYKALTAAEKAWYAYAGVCEVGDERTQAFQVYENVLNARRLW